jgi:hypothetical protein
MFEFLFLSSVNVASLPSGRPLGRQMIQPGVENKYRFNMQVSARPMDYRDRLPPQPNEAAALSV